MRWCKGNKTETEVKRLLLLTSFEPLWCSFLFYVLPIMCSLCDKRDLGNSSLEAPALEKPCRSSLRAQSQFLVWASGEGVFTLPPLTDQEDQDKRLAQEKGVQDEDLGLPHVNNIICWL